jgi:UDP-3-O-[3-hydroxymyristoyl] N-acetylglucosamine deacetylase
MQKTLNRAFTCSGIGLHSGVMTQVRVGPAEVGEGRYFVRTDLPGFPCVGAIVTHVQETVLSTALVQGEAKVRTVEHLLAALVGLGVTNARIEIDGGEVPLLDGSAQEWVSEIVAVGLRDQGEANVPWTLEQPLWVQEGEAFVVGFPAPQTRLSYEIDFPQLRAIGHQQYSLDITPETFRQEIAPARTFGFADQVEQLRSQGLIKGGNLDNALVCDREGWVNPPLRFDNEPVRHKLLDLIGDLSLLGVLPLAHILAYKASHKLHTQFGQALYAAQNVTIS